MIQRDGQEKNDKIIYIYIITIDKREIKQILEEMSSLRERKGPARLSRKFCDCYRTKASEASGVS